MNTITAVEVENILKSSLATDGPPSKYIAAYETKGGRQLALQRDSKRGVVVWLEELPDGVEGVRLRKRYAPSDPRNSNLNSVRGSRLALGNAAVTAVIDTLEGLTGLLERYAGVTEVVRDRRQAGKPDPEMTNRTVTDDVLEKVLTDARSRNDVVEETALRAIKTRRGQSEFRKALLEAYSRKCCVSGCSVEDVLEAAHITPHGTETNYSVRNGLLLRADLHTLFDLGLIEIGEDYCIKVSARLRESEYGHFEGRPIKLPLKESDWPDKEWVAKRSRQFNHAGE